MLPIVPAPEHCAPQWVRAEAGNLQNILGVKVWIWKSMLSFGQIRGL